MRPPLYRRSRASRRGRRAPGVRGGYRLRSALARRSCSCGWASSP